MPRVWTNGARGGLLVAPLLAWLDSDVPPARRARQLAKANLRPGAVARLRCLLRGFPIPRWGNLRRSEPMSEYFGFERGTPVDRYYLHRFLDAHRGLITGKVLEIQMPGYTRTYGRAVSVAHSVDIDPSVSPRPTFVVDLARAEDVIPDNTYDCFLLPNTLSVIEDIEGALRNALRVVKPGGVVLATTAGFVPFTGREDDFWRMSAAGWRQIAARVWPECEVQIEQHGNYLIAVGAMLGLAAEEFSQEELEAHHAKFPVATTLFCRKPPGAHRME